MISAEARQTTQDLIGFITESPTAAHTVAAAAARLEAAGFQPRSEGEAWTLSAGERFYVTRGYHSLIACQVGAVPPPEAGLRIAGAHTDTPGFRLKPNAAHACEGYLQLGVEVYGGPLLASWTDRDLTLAGKVFIRGQGGLPRMQLVRSERALCRIPQLAIHFNREVNTEGLKLDKQKHLPPIFGLGDEETLATDPLFTHIAELAGVAREAIVATDLELIDLQPPAIGGIAGELLFAPRIDNLAGCHALLSAMTRAGEPAAATRAIALFDSEEIGSQTLGGAGSQFLDTVLERICLSGGADREAWHRARTRSWLVSVDGVHAVHPNYADFHDPHHRPCLNGGPTIKVSALQRYATTALSRHWLEECAARAGVAVQHYVHRTDLRSGSTIGPMTATRLGIPTVDVGSPMLAMHAVRETGGVADQEAMIRVLIEHLQSDA